MPIFLFSSNYVKKHPKTDELSFPGVARGLESLPARKEAEYLVILAAKANTEMVIKMSSICIHCVFILDLLLLG